MENAKPRTRLYDYPTQVKAAMVAMQARGVYPGIEAIRTEMGGGDLRQIMNVRRRLIETGETGPMPPRPHSHSYRKRLIHVQVGNGHCPKPEGHDERIQRETARVAAELARLTGDDE